MIQNDFFKVIQDGQLCFLQKASDVSGQLRYSGSEAIILTGTDGKPGDYFLFSKRTASLQQVSAKNFETVTHSVFSGNQAALDKAGASKADIPDLKMAVEIYNAGK